jgi:DNA repair exonuclease SbcCD nuclease subunit
MSKVAAIFFADGHRDERVWTKRRDLTGDSLFASRWLIQKAVELHVPLFGAGDLIDVRKPAASTLNEIRKDMDLMADHGVPFYYIQGQHELSDPPWFNVVHDHPIHIDRLNVWLDAARTYVYGMDWTPGHELVERLAKVHSKTRILLCHQVWEEFMGDITSPEGSLRQVPTADTVFTGDYHRNKELHKVLNADGNRLRVISPGATHMRAINEPRAHYYYVLRYDRTWHRHDIPGRPTYFIKVTSEKSLKKLLKSWPNKLKHLDLHACKDLPAELRKPIVRVSYPDDIDAFEQLEAVMGDSCHLFHKDITKKQKTTRKTFEWVHSLSGGLAKTIGTDHNDYKPLKRLLDSADAEQELVAMKEERGLRDTTED